jgi:hypothetical protein
MKRLLLSFLLLVGLVSQGQVLQKMPAYGYQAYRMRLDSTVWVPNDTFAIRSDQRGFPAFCIKSDSTIYLWSVARQKWIKGGGGISDSSFAWLRYGNNANPNYFLGTLPGDTNSLRFKMGSFMAGRVGYPATAGTDSSVVSYGIGGVALGFQAGQWLGMTKEMGLNVLIGGGAGKFIGADYDNRIHNTTYGISKENTFMGWGAGHNTQHVNKFTGKGRNAFYGESSGFGNISGSDNAFFGAFSGERNNNGRGNSFFGRDAGRSNGDGDGNTFIGGSAGLNNACGVYQIVVDNPGTGYTSTPTIVIDPPSNWGTPAVCSAQATGTASIDVGTGEVTAIAMTFPGCGYTIYDSSWAGPWTTPHFIPLVHITGGGGSGATAHVVMQCGDYNTYIGGNAGGANVFGQYNTFVGEHAGANNRWFDSYTIGLGYQTGVSGSVPITTPITKSFSIGYNAQNTASNQYVLGGASSGDKLNGISNGTLTITDSAFVNTIKISRGAAMVPTNIGIGNLTLKSNTFGFANVVFGDSAAMSLTSHNGGVFIGFRAAKNLTGGFQSIGIGGDAMLYHKTGERNTIVGAQAMQNDSTGGQYNNGFGYGALFNCQNCRFNAVFGDQGLASGTTADSSTLVGSAVGWNITTGDANVIVGFNAGAQLTTGTANVLIGTRVASSSGNFSNQLWIHNTNTSSPLIWGDFAAMQLKTNGSFETVGLDNYTTNLGSSYTSRSKVDKNYVDSALATVSGGGGFSNPMTTLGDIIYENATPAATRLAGNTTTTKKFLTQTGNGSISAAPGWNTIGVGDIPDLTATYIKNQTSPASLL